MQDSKTNEVFAAQLEALNTEAGIKEGSNLLSPAFIEVYEQQVIARIKKSRRWSQLNSYIQILFMFAILYFSRSLKGMIFIDNKLLITVLILVMIFFNILASRHQKLLGNFEKQLLLIETYKKLR